MILILTRSDARAVLSWLQSMYDYLKVPDHWTQGAGARDARGHNLDNKYSALDDAYHAHATCYCLEHAIYREQYLRTKNNEGSLQDLMDARHCVTWTLNRAIADVGREGVCIYRYNDSHEHDEVLSLIARAMSIAQAATEEVQ